MYDPVLPNDLAAGKAADDAQQLLGGQAARFPGGEIELGHGTSSHEGDGRRSGNPAASCER